jgi:hypothetical protein
LCHGRQDYPGLGIWSREIEVEQQNPEGTNLVSYFFFAPQAEQKVVSPYMIKQANKTMKLLSATLLVLSSNASVVSGSNIRGSRLEKEQEQQESTRNLAVSLIISFA